MTKISEVLDGLREQLHTLKNDRAAGSPEKNSIWKAYAKLEHLLLLVKLAHGFESPGGFKPAKLDQRDGDEIMQLAVEHLEKAKQQLDKGSVEEAVGHLRNARDALKALLKA